MGNSRNSHWANSCPRFTTISYVWGEYLPEERVGIAINDTQFLVALSVPPILELIRNHADLQKVQWIWIGGICINQKDTVEKSAQVEMIGRIFEESEMTVAWLGKAEPDITDAAMDLLGELQRREKEFCRYREPDRLQINRILLKSRKWEPLIRFFNLPWWSRVWTLQEFILAQKLKLYWGNRSIDREELRVAVNAIWPYKPFERLMHWETLRPAWHRCRLYEWHSRRDKVGRKSLLAWLSCNAKSKLSDERDHIYGVLGLVDEEDAKLVGKPSYEEDNDARALYYHLARSWIQTYQYGGSQVHTMVSSIYRSRLSDDLTRVFYYWTSHIKAKTTSKAN